MLGMVLLLAVLLGVDRGLKHSSVPGFCPPDVRWIAAAEDFGCFFDGLMRSDAGCQFTDTVPKQLINYELAIRKSTGIRPTPLRWRVWMGKTFLAASSREGSGFCVRPGLLMRAAHIANRVFSRTQRDGRVFLFGSLFYGWREGFLVVSSSKSYVVASLEAPAPVVEESQGRNELRIHFPGARPAIIRIRGENGLPVSGWVTASLSRRTESLTVDSLWPEDTVARIAVSRWNDIVELTQAVYAPFSSAIALEQADGSLGPWVAAARGWTQCILDHWQTPVPPEGWDAQVDECAIGLLGVDVSTVTPVPELAMALRAKTPAQGPHPLEFLSSEGNAKPYEWDTVRGVLVPWLGERLTLCLASDEKDWLATSQEPLMARLLGSREETKGVASDFSADGAVTVNWRECAEPVGKLLTNAADFEFLGRMNKRDCERDLLPFVQALGKLGTLRVYAYSEQERVRFEGWLAFGAETRKTTKR